MVAKEIYPEQVEDNYTELQDLDETEEGRLSLCDLPIYNDAAEWDDFSKEDQSSSEDQEFFEFFSEDFSTASTCPAENIIFCGKLIPYKEPVSEETQKLQNNTEQYPKNKKRDLFQSKSKSFNKSKTSRSDGVKGHCMNNNHNNSSKLQQVSSSKSLAPLPASEKHRYTAGKCVDKYDISVPKVSPTKSRWHLFMFGLLSFPTEMELSDIRSRQHRRTPSSTLFQSFDGREEVTVGKSRGKGFWRLLSALGGGSTHHANAVVKASFGCIPRV